MFRKVTGLSRIRNLPSSSSTSRWISVAGPVNNSDTLAKGGQGSPTTDNDKKPLNNGIKHKKNFRTLSPLQNSTVPLANQAAILSKERAREFMSYFPDIVGAVMERVKKNSNQEIGNHVVRALQYNVPGGKKYRGMIAVQVYETIAPKDQLTEENLKLASLLGWLVEFLQANLLILDDITDGSTTRRGQPCWYMNEDIGLSGINDALITQESLFYILKTHFNHLECYTRLMETFHDATFLTVVGQMADMAASKKSVYEFNMEMYKNIVVNKTAYYTFYLPISLAMTLAGYSDPEAFRQARTILLEIGYFFQIQDDFLDCFGDPQVTGKIGTDIQEGKCTWLAVVFMQRASREQKKVFADNYGKKEEDAVAIVKQLYEDVGLPNTYAIYEEDSYNMMKTHVQQTSRGVPHEVFFMIMNKIYRRNN